MAAYQPRAAGKRWIVPMAIALTFVITFCALANYVYQQHIQNFPQIVGHNCGTVTSTGRQTFDLDQGELCLWQAYTSCKTSTLIFVFQGIDTGDTHAITVQPKSGGCAVNDTFQPYSASSGRTFGVTTVSCSGIQRLTGGLLLTACGSEGKLYLPPRPPEQAGHVCGMLLGGNHTASTEYPWAYAQATVAGIEDCFWQAYSSCARPATLVYDSEITLSSGVIAFGRHTLIAQASQGSCALTDVVATFAVSRLDVTYTCASLTRNTDGGLVARGCGAQGDVVIPPAAPPNK